MNKEKDKNKDLIRDFKLNYYNLKFSKLSFDDIKDIKLEGEDFLNDLLEKSSLTPQEKYGFRLLVHDFSQERLERFNEMKMNEGDLSLFREFKIILREFKDINFLKNSLKILSHMNI